MRKEEQCFFDSSCVQLVILKTEHEAVQIKVASRGQKLEYRISVRGVNLYIHSSRGLLTLLSVHGLNLPVGEEANPFSGLGEIVSEEDS